MREVTFNGEGIDGKGIQIPYQVDHSFLLFLRSLFLLLCTVIYLLYFSLFFSLKLLLNFFDAGIERITVNPGALIHKDVSRHILEKLVNVSVQ